MRVEKGDTLAITEFTMSLKDVPSASKVDPPPRAEIPAWAAEYEAGAAFQLRQALEERYIALDPNAARISQGGRVLEIAFRRLPEDVFSLGRQVAERILDLISVDTLHHSELDEPLRSYVVWRRVSGATTLTCLDSARLAASIKMRMEVRDPDGVLRPVKSRPPREWHASFAYFRQSQLADDLGDAYRYLFLALEALLSEVYPWERGVGEQVWLKSALKHVANGYGIDLNRFLETTRGNPYKGFLKEQYQAQRCALFHAKMSEQPVVPGTANVRKTLMSATKRLGDLYILLAQKITGAAFPVGGFTHSAFADMCKSFADGNMYISNSAEFNIETCKKVRTAVSIAVMGNPNLHHLKGTWSKDQFPKGPIRRSGFLLKKDGHEIDGGYISREIDTTHIDVLEIICQHEITNAQHLRELYM